MRFIKSKLGAHVDDVTLSSVYVTGAHEYYADKEFIKSTGSINKDDLRRLLPDSQRRNTYNTMSKVNLHGTRLWLLALSQKGDSLNDPCDLVEAYDSILTSDETEELLELEPMELDEPTNELRDVNALLGGLPVVEEISTPALKDIPTQVTQSVLSFEEEYTVPETADTLNPEVVEFTPPEFKEVTDEPTERHENELFNFNGNLPEHLLESVASLVSKNIPCTVIESDSKYTIEIAK